MAEISNNAIVVYRGTCVHNAMLTNGSPAVDDRTCHHHRTFAYGSTGRYRGFRMNGRYPFFHLQTVHNRLAYPAIPNAHYGTVVMTTVSSDLIAEQ